MTILLSIILFSHPMNKMHLIGLTMIFIVIGIEVKKAYQKQK